MSINMVEPVEGSVLPEPLGAIRKITIINVGEATRDISDELQVAFSEMGLNLLTTKDSTSAAPMVTGSQPR